MHYQVLPTYLHQMKTSVQIRSLARQLGHLSLPGMPTERDVGIRKSLFLLPKSVLTGSHGQLVKLPGTRVQKRSTAEAVILRSRVEGPKEYWTTSRVKLVNRQARHVSQL